MPVSRFPRKRDFFVYTFRLNGYPYYVGIGRSGRASMRAQYVASLLTKENSAKLARSCLSVKVMAALLKRGEPIEFSRTRRKLNRHEALELERELIAKLLRRGFHLTNWQHNPFRHQDVSRAVRAILRQTLRE